MTSSGEHSDWRSRGECLDHSPEAFYADSAAEQRAAKKICLGCEVITQCLQFAVDNNERYGIWGGKNYEERKRLRSQSKGGAPRYKHR